MHPLTVEIGAIGSQVFEFPLLTPLVQLKMMPGNHRTIENNVVVSSSTNSNDWPLIKGPLLNRRGLDWVEKREGNHLLTAIERNLFKGLARGLGRLLDLKQKADQIAFSQRKPIAGSEPVTIASREGKVIDVGTVGTANILNKIAIPLNPNIGMDPGDNLRVREPGDINIGRDAIVGFANMDHSGMAGEFDGNIRLHVQEIDLLVL